MAESRPRLVDLLRDLDELATPANLRYGTAIHGWHGVEFKHCVALALAVLAGSSTS